MKLRFLVIILLLPLSGCLSHVREELQECTDAAALTYPSSSLPPIGQPYKDILACMNKAGYTLDHEACKYGDYTTLVNNARCYRPIGFVSGYFHDISMVLR